MQINVLLFSNWKHSWVILVFFIFIYIPVLRNRLLWFWKHWIIKNLTPFSLLDLTLYFLVLCKCIALFLNNTLPYIFTKHTLFIQWLLSLLNSLSFFVDFLLSFQLLFFLFGEYLVKIAESKFLLHWSQLKTFRGRQTFR